jgi:catechol 2,3-dioxygenase-like lactoylglutathione lyase family enzyme
MASRYQEASSSQRNPRLYVAYPQLFVTDMARAIAFYQDKLGFSVEYLYGDLPFYGLVSRDGAGLNLRLVDSPVVDAALRERESLLSAHIPVAGVEDLFHEFHGRNVAFAQMLQAQPWGAIDFVVRDIDGNLLCFASAVTKPGPRHA